MPSLISEVRSVPAIVAVMMALLSNRFWILDRASEPDGPVPWLGVFWPWWFLGAGLACLAMFLRPHSRWALALSGAMTAVGLAWRAVAVLLALSEGAAGLTAVQLHIAGIVYTLASFTVALVWLRILRPASFVLRRIPHHGRLLALYTRP